MTDQQVAALTRAWVDAWDELEPEFSETLVDILTGKERVTATTLAKNRRLSAALRQARGTLDALTDNADALIVNDVETAVLDAVDGHMNAVQSQLPPGQVAVQVGFDRLSPEAIAAIVERTTQQIHSSTMPLAPDVEVAMKRELIRGITVGDNPRTTARRIIRRTEGAFNGGLVRATRIARTEMLDAHRNGDQAAAQHNKDLLEGWYWSATLDTRTCPSCLANHRTFHPVDEFGPIDHPNGRCARIDKTKSWRDLGFNIDEPEDDLPDAHAWFDNLDDSSQLRVMGPTRLDLLNSGKVTWADLTTRHSADGWRDSMTATSVADLIKKPG
nr:phage minor head protein [Zhihengliuella flava]